jgi:predicted ATPase/DNA-binding XRE family transcriptional regulator
MAHDSFQTFGELLTYLRKRARLTQDELARAVGYGREQIVRLEKNQRVPDRAVIAAVFVPALDLDDVPELAQRLLDLASHTRSVRSNLPAQLTSFIGREVDVAAVRDYLCAPDKRLITLIGPPGIGKTRLSLQVAHDLLPDFANGVFFVPLAPIADLTLVAPGVAHTLGFPELSGVRAEERLIAGIGQRQMLIVLDNFEQIIDAAPLIPDLLRACPNLKIMVTSRESLRVPGEWLYPVPPLAMPTEAQLKTLVDRTIDQFSALQLFAERARAVQPDFTVTPKSASTVAAICRQLDGLPLAIELIASRIRLMSPQVLLMNLTSDFTLHADGMRGVPARQKTLHNAIAWSYDRLSQEEQALLAHLSVFAGGFTLEAAQAITRRPTVLNGVMSLLDKSLLIRAIEAQGETRFNQLVMIHDFALDQLRARNEEAALRDQHLAYFLDLAGQADTEIHGPDQVRWMDRLEKETDNFRAALEWCVAEQNTEAGLRLLGALSWPWRLQTRDSETRHWFDRLRALPEASAHPALYARLLNELGHSIWLAGDARDARSVLEESRAIWLKLGVRGECGLAESLNLLGLVIRSGEGDYQAAQACFERSFELCHKQGDRRGMAFALFNLGNNAGERNDDASALSLFEQSLDLYYQLGDVWGVARTAQYLGQLFLKQGFYEKARVYFEQHLKIDEELHFKQGTAVALFNLGDLHRYQCGYDQAEQYYEMGLALCHEYGLNDWGIGSYSLGMVALHQNNYPLAVRLFTDYFNSTWKSLGKTGACDFLTGSAAIAAGMNQPECAGKLYGAAQTVFERTDYRIPRFDHAEFDRHLQIARDQLGEETFAALQAEGRALTLEQAIDLALQVTS